MTPAELRKRLHSSETSFRQARAAGVGAGINLWGEIEQQADFLTLGANLLIHSADLLLFQKLLIAELKAVKQAAGLLAGDQALRAGINVESIAKGDAFSDTRTDGP